MIKIIAGERRGAQLFTLSGQSTRPLRGRVREALFNIIQFEIAGRRVLDCYAGSGAVGLEALSRGAAHAAFIEDNRDAREVIRRNIAKLRFEDRAEIVAGRLPETLEKMVSPEPFNLVFVMPPYNSGLIEPMLEALRRPALVDQKALVIVEIENRETIQVPEAHWRIRDDRTYGVTRLLFLNRSSSDR